jgi:hypothetical protein
VSSLAYVTFLSELRSGTHGWLPDSCMRKIGSVFDREMALDYRDHRNLALSVSKTDDTFQGIPAGSRVVDRNQWVRGFHDLSEDKGSRRTGGSQFKLTTGCGMMMKIMRGGVKHPVLSSSVMIQFVHLTNHKLINDKEMEKYL